MFIQDNSKVLGYSPQFSESINFVKILGGKYEFVPLKSQDDFAFSEEDFLDSINGNWDLIYIDNPNNPTGQIIELAKIERIAKKAEGYGIPVIIDEAYGDFMDNTNSSIALLDQYKNLMVVRSFSKGLGLANLRLGYVITKGPIKNYYSMVNIPPFVFADILTEIAIEALLDENFIVSSQKQIKNAKEKLLTHCQDKFAIAKTSLETPIFLISHPDEEVDLYDLFLKKGIITAPGEEFPGIGKNSVRVRIPVDIDGIIQRLEDL